MPNKVIRGKRKSMVGLANNLKTTQRQTANLFLKPELERIVAPFETNIPFVLRESSSGDSEKVLVGPDLGPTTLNAAGDTVRTADIFFWLDQGTDVRYVTMPDDFSNETSPGSLATRRAEYDRARIKVDRGNPHEGIEARNFLEQVGKQYERTYFRRMRTTLSNGLK